MVLSPHAAAVGAPAQAIEAGQHVHHQLGEILQALYLYGSTVDAGLQPASDLDLLAVLRRPLHDTERHALMAMLLAHSQPPGDAQQRALEMTFVVLDDIVPWRHPARRELQFGEWLRDDLLAGHVADAEPDPDLALLLTQARRRSLVLLGEPAADLLPVVPHDDVRSAILAMRDEVARNAIGDERNALLTLARMALTLQTGEIVGKAEAATRIAAELPDAQRDVLLHARDVYLGLINNDWRGCEQRVTACAAHLLATMPAVGDHADNRATNSPTI